MANWSEHVSSWIQPIGLFMRWTLQSLKMLDIRTVLYHIIFLVSYVLCFVYLYYPNTEMISVMFLLVLHLVFLFFLGYTRPTLPGFDTLRNIQYNPTSWDITQIFNLQFADYSVPIIVISWIFMFLALVILVQDYLRLYQTYIPHGMEPTFGKMDGFKQKVLGLLSVSTVLIWFFYILQHIKGFFSGFTQRNKVVNSFVLVFAVILVTSSVYSYQLSRYVNDHLGTVVIPPPIM
jgi:hypothetical protein